MNQNLSAVQGATHRSPQEGLAALASADAPFSAAN